MLLALRIYTEIKAHLMLCYKLFNAKCTIEKYCAAAAA